MEQYSLRQAGLLLFITLAGIITSVILHFSLVFGILPGSLFLIYVSLKKGYDMKRLLTIGYEGIGKVKIVLMILFLISFLLPTWFLSGTINSMVSVTLQAINPHHFFVFCFLTTMIFSMILGSSIGTLSALGVPLMSTAVLLHIPIDITAGAVISGAFVGDRTSPFSSAHQLLANILQITVKKQGKAMLLTSVLAILVSVLFFNMMDVRYASDLYVIHHELDKVQKISFIHFLPPILLVLLVLCRLNIILSYVISILSGSFIAIVNDISISEIVHALWYGIDGLGGGLIHMYSLLLFIAIAGVYNAMLEELNVIQPILDKWLISSTSIVSDSFKTVIASLFICIIAGNQTMPIILTGRSFITHWTTKYSKEELARVMSDTTLLFPAMIPWNVLAIMSGTVVNMKLYDYIPYAIFLWILPCLTLIVSFAKKRKDYQTSYEIST